MKSLFACFLLFVLGVVAAINKADLYAYIFLIPALIIGMVGYWKNVNHVFKKVDESPIKPCPHCGYPVTEKTDEDGLTMLICPPDSTCRGSGLGTVFFTEKRTSAIQAWNRRARR